METVLSVVITSFLILMCLWLVEAIIQGIFYIIFQRTGRFFPSVFVRFRISVFCFSLEHKGKLVDTAFAYTKHKRHYYVLGLNGVYKIGFNQFIKLDETNLQRHESDVINEMRKECYARVQKDREIFDLFIQHNEKTEAE